MMSLDTTDSARDTTTMLGTVGIVGVAAFASVFAVMHAVQPDLDPVERFGSDYANGKAGWLMQAGILAAAAGTLAVVSGLRRSLVPGKRKRLGVALLFVVGVGFVGSGLFKADPPRPDGTTGYTAEGAVHDLSGMFMFLSLVVGTFVLAGVFRRDPRWREVAPTALIFGALILAGLVVTVAAAEIDPPGSGDGGFAGLSQRLFFTAALTWIGLLGLNVRRLGSAPMAHTGGGSEPSEQPDESTAATGPERRGSTRSRATSASRRRAPHSVGQ